MRYAGVNYACEAFYMVILLADFAV